MTLQSNPFLLAEGICKSFGGVPVLSDVTIGFERGSVHGLVGENGAGKSTFTKILAGVLAADRGVVRKDGTPIRLNSPHAALAHGVTMITQELALVRGRSVLENVLMGRLSQRLGWVNTRAGLARFRELSDQAGFADLPPFAAAGSLPIARQQEVEILRALARDAQVIIMDEPTATLSDTETKQLLALIRRLAGAGISIVFVSHFLEQVLAVCDTVSVLRDGRLIETGHPDSHSPATLVRAMVGRNVDVLYPEPAPVADNAPVVLSVKDLGRGSMVRGVSFDIRRGEILGLSGLVGAGRSETARLIFGADHAEKGAVEVDGAVVSVASPAAAMRAGLAMVPENRKEDGLVLGRSLRENISLASLHRLSAGWMVQRKKERRETTTMIEQTGIRGSDLEGPVWALSGGNQQKALFARWLMRQPTVLIVDEPTRGVDVAAKVQIHQLLRDLAAAGHALLIISSEIEEVMGMSHRVCVMSQGRIVATFQRGEADRETVLAAAFSGLGSQKRSAP